MAGKISIVLNILLAAAVIYLFIKISDSKEELSLENISTLEGSEEKVYPSIAYVNNDSLQTNYKLMTDITDELKKTSDNISSLETKFQKDQKKRANVEAQFSANVQNGVYKNEAEANEAYIKAGEEAEFLERELTRVQNQLNNLYPKYQNKTILLNDSLLGQINKYIDSFSQQKNIDLILIYTQNQTGLYANGKLDITEEVVSGLNSQYEADKALAN